MSGEKKRFVDEDDVVALSPIDAEEVLQELGLCPHGFAEGECDECPGGASDCDEDDPDPGFSYMN